MNVIQTRRTFFLALLLPAAAHAATMRTPEPHEIREGAEHSLNNLPVTAIGTSDAAAIQAYYRGQAVAPSSQPRAWAIGRPLPWNVAAEPLPPELKARVSPLYGYHYERVGGDVVLLADSTRVVAGAMPIA